VIMILNVDLDWCVVETTAGTFSQMLTVTLIVALTKLRHVVWRRITSTMMEMTYKYFQTFHQKKNVGQGAKAMDDVNSGPGSNLPIMGDMEQGLGRHAT